MSKSRTTSIDLHERIGSSLPDIIELARFAPSVHNTQPWIIRLEEDVIIVSVDPEHRLVDGDPTGRQTIISLGIFIEAISISAADLSFAVQNVWLENGEAHLQLSQSKKKVNVSHLLQALKTRTTDRSIYDPAKLSIEMEQRITKVPGKIKAKVWVLTDQKAIEEVAVLTAKGIGVALSNPQFREELSHYLVQPWSAKQRGISTSSLYIPKLLAVCEPVLIRLGIGLGAEVALERKRWLSASAVVLITTPGDVADYWFAAGRAYLHVALTIEELGLSQATSAATVEASNYHEDIEGLVHTAQRLQSVLRIGKGATERSHSPRLSTKDLLTSH